MDTLSQTMNQLKAEGYTEDLNLQKDCIECRARGFKMFHDEFVIDKVFRFEGESNPSDEATLYAISSTKSDIKGVLVNGGGIYTDEITDEMLESLQIKRN